MVDGIHDLEMTDEVDEVDDRMLELIVAYDETELHDSDTNDELHVQLVRIEHDDEVDEHDDLDVREVVIVVELVMHQIYRYDELDDYESIVIWVERVRRMRDDELDEVIYITEIWNGDDDLDDEAGETMQQNIERDEVEVEAVVV